jgi:acetolactate synthase I/II/III large subunit
MNFKNISKKTGAYILIDNLIQNGVEHIFGYPGGAILPIYDELYFWEKKGLIKHILVRHEQSAAHAADAYSRSTNKVGVCFATSGPGATNLITGIATAKMDSIPLIIITGQVTKNFIGTDAFQETNIFGITLPIVKYSYIIKDIKKLPEIVSEAFYLAQNGRPGPILIDIPKDIGLEKLDHYNYVNFYNLKNKKYFKINFTSKIKYFEKILLYFKKSYQPLFYIGGGGNDYNLHKSIQLLSKIFEIPITTTLMGKSLVNEKDYLSLGMLGMHGTAYANFSVSQCDLLFTLGARFDDRVTGKLNEFASEAKVIHIDIDPTEISKNRLPQLSIIGDSRKILIELLKILKNFNKTKINERKNWLKKISKWKQLYPLINKNYKKNILSPQEAIYYIGQRFPNAIYTTDVGQHQMWCAQLLNCQPKKWLSSSGLGTMGYGLPAAIGAKIGNLNQKIFCISGDSSFQMNLQELGTISQYNLNFSIIIINNGWQGMVRQWQECFYGNRFSNSFMKNGMPDFLKLAKAYNLIGYEINEITELDNINFCNNKTSLIININVIEKENCYPMVTPGKNNSYMIGLR